VPDRKTTKVQIENSTWLRPRFARVTALGAASRLPPFVLLLAACSSTPDATSTAEAARASDPAAGAAPAASVNSEEFIVGHYCNNASCSASCATEPAVPGGHCIAERCLCDAPQFPPAPSWRGWESIGGNISSNPVAVATKNLQWGAFAVAGGNVVEQWYTGGTLWPANGNWANLGNNGHPFRNVAAASVATGIYASEVELFAVDPATGHLMHQEGNASDGAPTWNAKGWEDLGGNLSFQAPPTVLVSQPGNQISVLGMSATTTGIAYIQGTGYGAFGPWSTNSIFTSTPAIVSPPAAVSWGSDRIDVFARGGDNALYQITSTDNGTTWSSSWANLGGALLTAPTVVSWGPNRIDIFADQFGTGALYNLSFNGTAWGGWQPMTGAAWEDINGGAVMTAIATAPWNLQVFVQGTDRTLYSNSLIGADVQGYPTWGEWRALTSCFGPGAAAAVVSRDGSSLDLFALGSPAANGATSVFHSTTDTTYDLGPSASPPACPLGGLGEPCGNLFSCANGPGQCQPGPGGGPLVCSADGALGQPCRQSVACVIGQCNVSIQPQCNAPLACNGSTCE
jgi:hypothetical protein